MLFARGCYNIIMYNENGFHSNNKLPRHSCTTNFSNKIKENLNIKFVIITVTIIISACIGYKIIYYIYPPF